MSIYLSWFCLFTNEWTLGLFFDFGAIGNHVVDIHIEFFGWRDVLILLDNS